GWPGRAFRSRLCSAMDGTRVQPNGVPSGHSELDFPLSFRELNNFMSDLVKNLMLWVVVAVVLMVVFQSFNPKTAGSDEIIYSQFITDVRNDRIKEVDIASDERSIKFIRSDGSKGVTTAPRRDERLIDDLLRHDVSIKQAPPESGVTIWALLINFLPVLLIIGFWFFMMRQMQQGGSKGAMSFGRSRAKLLNEDQTK